MGDARPAVRTEIAALEPLDALETAHRAQALAWIDSGAGLWRLAKPDVPPRHLVAYFPLIDAARGQVLLCDHRLSGLWLPPGGHVEPGEPPRDTAIREAREELGIEARFTRSGAVFLTITTTVGMRDGNHEDVSLWYALEGNSSEPLAFDQREFQTVQWFDVDQWTSERCEQHLPRFLAKLRREGVLARQIP